MNPLPDERELDALREVANIGCGHAATALSTLVGGRTVRLEVPRALVLGTRELGELLGGSEGVLCALLGMEGELRGRLLLCWPETDAHVLCGLLLGTSPGVKLTEQPSRSALEEVANIVISACLSAVARLTGLRLLPTTPELWLSDGRTAAAKLLSSGDAGEKALLLEARFLTANAPALRGQLLLLPDPDALPTLLRTLGV